MTIIATVAMLFASFTAAILVRRTGMDWVRVSLPAIVWLNTAVIVVSSVVIEFGRGAVRRNARRQAVRLLEVAALLGGLFLVGQLAAWFALVGQGILLPTNPHASFFYVLSAVHGAHVVGGIGALIWTMRRAKQGAYTPRHNTGLLHAAIYWHFVGIVWLYVLVLLNTL
jgi:cytochrome c oxidase subunit 3